MEVWHARTPGFGFGAPPMWPSGYEKVAEVEDDSLGDAFTLTNHISGPWWENEGVTLVGGPTHRSTSVGDVVVMPDGQVVRCEMIGWRKVPT